jgi:hypothetical protein
MATPLPPPSSPLDPFQFFHVAVEYYMQGRFGFFAGLTHAASHDLHFAIELYVKGCLCGRHPVDELKKLGHKLNDLWSKLKKDSPSLQEFDSTVMALDEFHELRYPLPYIGNHQVGFSLTLPNKLMAPGPSTYLLALHDIDRLVLALYRFRGVVPRASSHIRAGEKYLLHEHPCPQEWQVTLPPWET